MNQYKTYHRLCTVHEILENYPETEELRKTAVELMDAFTCAKYRVAVVGEFKRGKSSLVNTLLGTEILPTDILPTTAVVNRIVYDTDEKIEIHKKDGSVIESTVEDLANYATKLDAEKEKTSSEIREIVVRYPTVFGQNNIEIIDTPGLNDNERMTETTLEILDKIDTAIVVISATIPLSMTEQKLICDLIAQEYIFHLTFAASFIDRIEGGEVEQDRAIDKIRERLMNDTYSMFCSLYPDDEELKAKAASILGDPDIFGISSKLAMDGFIKNNERLLEKSRFPHFKLKLMSLLTAERQMDMEKKAFLFVRKVRDVLDTLNSSGKEISAEEEKKLLASREILEWYMQNNIGQLNRDLEDLDKTLEKAGFSCESPERCRFFDVNGMKKIFIRYLSGINASEYSEETVMNTVTSALADCKAMLSYDTAGFIKKMLTKLKTIEDNITEYDRIIAEEINDAPKNHDIFFANTLLRKNADLDNDGINDILVKHGFPTLTIDMSALRKSFANCDGDIMPGILCELHRNAKDYCNGINSFICSRRLVFLKYRNEVRKKIQARLGETEISLGMIRRRALGTDTETAEIKAELTEMLEEMEKEI